MENNRLRTVAILLACALLSCSPKPIIKPSPDTLSAQKKQFTPTFTITEMNADYYERNVEVLKPHIPDSIILINPIQFRYSYLAHMEKTHAYVPAELETELNKAMKAEDFQKAMTLADTILQIDFTDIRAHMLKAYAQKKTGQDFTFHKVMVDRLEQSILASGDGHTPETAFHVAQVKEEYQILNAFGLRTKGQSLRYIGSHAFDVMDCENKDKKQFTVYFDITEHMKRLAREFH